MTSPTVSGTQSWHTSVRWDQCYQRTLPPLRVPWKRSKVARMSEPRRTSHLIEGREKLKNRKGPTVLELWMLQYGPFLTQLKMHLILRIVSLIATKDLLSIHSLSSDKECDRRNSNNLLVMSYYWYWLLIPCNWEFADRECQSFYVECGVIKVEIRLTNPKEIG